MRCVRLSPALRRCGPCGRIALLLLSGLSLSLVESGAVFAQPATTGQQQIGHPFAAHIAEAAQRFRIPEHWIVAVMGAESAGATRAVSSAGAMGLMQVMPDTLDHLRARYRLGRDPFDPRDNILAGAAYLREMYDRYGAIPAMLAAYNAGPARYDEYLATGRPLPAETRAWRRCAVAERSGRTAIATGLARGTAVRPALKRPPDRRQPCLRGTVEDVPLPRPGAARTPSTTTAGIGIRRPRQHEGPVVTDAMCIRALLGSGVAWRAPVGAAGPTTARWQDKRAHIVRQSVGCFAWIFWRVPHIAQPWRNVRRPLKCPCLRGFSHLAERSHGR